MQTNDSTINSEQPVNIADAMRQTMDDIKQREEKEEKREAKQAEKKAVKLSQKDETNETKPSKEASEQKSSKEVKSEQTKQDDEPNKTETKTSKEKEENTTEASDKTQDKTKDEDKVEAKEEHKDEKTEPKKTVRAPSSWSAKAKDSFYELPEHIQQEVLKREEDFHSGIKQYKEKADFSEKIQRIIQPYEPALRASGQNTEQVIQILLDASYRLSQGTPQQKAQYLLQVAQESGADLQSLLNHANNTQNTGQNTSTQDNYVRQLEQRLAQLEGNYQQQATLSQQQQEQQVLSEIESFKNAVDESGRPKHPYFENVENDMAALITMAKQQGRPVPTLSQAYEQAVWANTQTREALLLKQQKEAQARKEAEASRKAEEAERKIHSNVRTRQNVDFDPNAPMGDIRDTMRAKMRDLNARN